MRRTTKWPRLAVAAFALTVGVATAAVAQGGPKGPKPSDRPTVVVVGDQPPMPPELVEATERRAAAAARGVDLPMPVWDERAGDVVLDAKGSPVMSDRLRFDAQGKLVRDTNGRPIVGEPQRRPTPGETCGSTPQGCGR